MRRLVYTDGEGRKTIVQIPDGAPESDGAMGILVGPPPLESLGLPLDVEVRLNNELYNRGLFTGQDIKRRTNEVVAAVIAAYKVDAVKIIELYRGGNHA